MCGCLHMTSGAIYPGVPEVSFPLSGFQYLAMPKSVTLTYPKIMLIIFTITVQNQIFWFYISMDNLFIMQIFQTHENTSHKEPCLLLIESSLTPNVVAQVPAAQIIHHHVQIISVLKRIKHIYNKSMFKV